MIVVDLQPSFLKAIDGGSAILRRSEFLIRIAGLLGVPVLATVQNSSRMGGIEPELAPHLTEPAFEKMAFSCMGCAPFVSRLSGLERKWAVLIGIETHICVSQTAHHLIDQEYEVAIGIDAVGSRTEDRHESGIARLRDVGATVAHTEAIAYEWLHSAEHPRFRDALEIVKSFT